MHQTWQKNENHYREAIGYMPEFSDMHRAMAELCNWIGKSNLSASLFGGTSMHALLITQVELENLNHPSIQYLRIEPDFKTKKIEFRFLDTHLEERQWHRIEPPNSQRLIKRFIGFLKQVGWAYEIEGSRIQS